MREAENGFPLYQKGPVCFHLIKVLYLMVVFQDVMVFDRSVLYAVPEEDDMHEDMRLDVDNMSYEVTLQKIGTLHAKHF